MVLILVPAIVLDAHADKPIFVKIEQNTRQIKLCSLIDIERLLYEVVYCLHIYLFIFTGTCIQFTPIHDGTMSESVWIIKVEREPLLKKNRHIAPIELAVIPSQRVATIFLRAEL
tara:strand:- start:1 stop:345 length:345 start_codon:yes stop_codon:yes gene_type:complete